MTGLKIKDMNVTMSVIDPLGWQRHLQAKHNTLTITFSDLVLF